MTIASAESPTPAGFRRHIPVTLISLGHGSVHWIAATWYLLLPFIRDELGLSYAQIGLLVSVFHISSMAANLPSGTLVDVTGRRVLIQAAALVVGALGLLFSGFTDSFLVLALLVVLIGATNMVWHPAAISFLSIQFPHRRGFALAIHALGANLGDAAAPLTAGTLLLVLSWQTTAVVGALPAIVVAAVIVLLLNRTDNAMTAAGERQGFRDYLAGMRLVVRSRAIWSLCIMSAFRSLTHAGLLAFLPLYLADELKVNPFWMGFTIMALQLGGAVSAPIAGGLSDSIGRRPVVRAGLLGTTVMVFGLTFVTNPALYIAGISVLGFCLYALRPVMHSWALDLSPPKLSGSVTSLMMGTQSALSALMPIVGGVLADRYGLISVFYLLSATVVVANFLTVFVPKET